jgi:uncharacterized protein YkwD
MSLGARPGRYVSTSRRTALAIALLFGLTSVATLAAPPRTLAWDGNTFDSTSEASLVALTNRARASAGLRALNVDPTLTSIARWRSKDMIEQDYFSHDIPGYGRNGVFAKLHEIDYCYKSAGENIGWNTYPDGEATSAIQQMFMDSSAHRANLLGSAYEVIGVGAYKGSGDKKMWTVLFADRCGTSPTPTPKPTPEPTVRPTPTPEPTARPTPAPTPTPQPKPDPTPRPTPKPTPVATATPSPTPAPAATPAPTPRSTPTPRPTLEATASPTPKPAALPKAAPTPTSSRIGLRITERGASRSLLDVTVSGVTGSFYGG